MQTVKVWQEVSGRIEKEHDTSLGTCTWPFHTQTHARRHMHTRTCTHVSACTHTHTHRYMPRCMHTHTHVHTHVCIQVHTLPVDTRAHIRAQVYMYTPLTLTHAYTYAHTHICIYTHTLPVYTCTHTCIHVHTPSHTHMAHLRFASLWEFSDCFRFFASPTPGLMEPCPSQALVTFCESMLWAVALSSRWHLCGPSACPVPPLASDAAGARQVLRTTTVPAGEAGGASLPVCPEPRVPSLSRALVTSERGLLRSLGLIKRNVVQHI